MARSSKSALGAEKLLDLMVKSLPPKASGESGPVAKDAYAAMGFFAHACMLAVGFRLVGLGEDHKIGTCNIVGLSP
jgi:PI31 proteasome regulator N-terminal